MPAHRPVIALLAGLLLGVCLLVYIPAPDSADGQALLAVAASIIRHGRFDIPAIAYTEWLIPESGSMGTPGLDGALYAKKGLTPSIALLPLAALGHLMPWLPLRATAMLFNPLVTTLTALALYGFGRWLGYGRWAACALGLIYGLATLALPYARTLFGEPLAALLLLLALMAAWHYRRLAQTRALVICGLCLGLLVGINTIYALYSPLLALYALWPRPVRLRPLIAFGLPLALVLAALGLYNWARFGSPLESGYHFDAGEGFNTPLLTGLYGLFLSPYRGLAWYSPLLLLSIPGWRLFRRAHGGLAWLIIACAALQALAFATWWSWHGGIVWGPRFLLPALPLLALLLLPLIAAARHDRLILAALAGFGLLSLAVQLLGVLYSYLPYDGLLRIRFWPDIKTANQALLTSPPMYDPAYSPIIGHVALLVARWPLEPAWLRDGVDPAHLLAALAVMAAGVTGWRWGGASRRVMAFAVVVMLVALGIVAARQSRTPDHQMARALADALQPPGVIVVASDQFGDSLLDMPGGRVISMNAPTAPDDAMARFLWRDALRQGGVLWLVSWFGPADALNWQARELWADAWYVGEAAAAGHFALRFDLAPDDAPLAAGGWRFGPVTLTGYALSPGADGLRLRLDWAAVEDIAADYTWFVHLVDPAGMIAAQQDRAPQGGYAPTSGWLPGAPVTDRLFFPLPPGADVRGWRVRIGWVDPASGERLPAFGPDGSPLADGFALLPVE